MNNLRLIPGPVTRKIFNKTNLIYSPAAIWSIFDHLTQGGYLTQTQTDDLYDFFLSIGILVIAQKYPHDAVKYKEREGFISNEHQVDELMEIVLKLHDYFVDQPQRVTDKKYFPTAPIAVKDERRFHAHFKNKAGNLWTDEYRKRKNDPLKRRLTEANDSFGEGEDADERRTAVHAEAMTDTFDLLMMKTPAGYSIDLFKACSSEKIYKSFSEKAKDTINSIYFSQHYKQFIKNSTTDAKLNKYKPLISVLSENKIQLETIFSFLNPMSQKDKEDKDYNYIIQGAISAITTAIMSSFKKEEGKLQIVLTKDETFLDTKKLAEMTSDFLKSIIEKDFDIKRGEVSSEAASIVKAYLSDMNEPFKVSIPEGTEYDSFRTMVEMNGQIKVSVPFTTQGEDPFWSNEEVINDKMVQIVDDSITITINQINIGKEILKHL